MMDFKPLTVSDYPQLKPLFAEQSFRLSIYSLPSVTAWSNHIYYPVFARHENMVLIGAEYEKTPEKRHLILPASPAGELVPPDRLASLCEEAGYSAFWFVPQCYLDAFEPDTVGAWFEIAEQSAYEDYIYNQFDLAHLKGNRYSKKRNLINQFLREYPENQRIFVESITPENRDACLDFLEKWCEMNDCDGEVSGELMCEKQAIYTAMEYLDRLDFTGILLRIDDDISAFGMASHLRPDMGVLHFEKAYSHIKGLYQYFDRECARRLFSGKAYINKESDMGVEGLAHAKRSYHPVARIKSYKLILKK